MRTTYEEKANEEEIDEQDFSQSFYACRHNFYDISSRTFFGASFGSLFGGVSGIAGSAILGSDDYDEYQTIGLTGIIGGAILGAFYINIIQLDLEDTITSYEILMRIIAISAEKGVCFLGRSIISSTLMFSTILSFIGYLILRPDNVDFGYNFQSTLLGSTIISLLAIILLKIYIKLDCYTSAPSHETPSIGSTNPRAAEEIFPVIDQPAEEKINFWWDSLENELIIRQISVHHSNRNFFQLLGIRRNSNIETIKRSFNILALKYHPDKYIRGEEEAFRNILEARDYCLEYARTRHEEKKDYSLEEKEFQNPVYGASGV